MALLIYSNGMDVRVATVDNHSLLYEVDTILRQGHIAATQKQIQWEYCNDNPSIKDLEDRLALQAAYVKEQELKIADLKMENATMHERITRAYNILDHNV